MSSAGKTVVHVRAPNDINGNPRRLFLVLQNGGVLGAVNEGNQGSGALLAYRDGSQMRALIATEIYVSANEYKRLLRQFGPGTRAFVLVPK